MKNIIKSQVVTLVSLLTAIVLSVAACGGGGSSGGAGGGSAGSTIAGTVNGGNASIGTSDSSERWLVFATALIIRSADATGVDDLTLQLIDSGGTVVATEMTHDGGNFAFTGLAPGVYTIRVLQGDVVLGETDSIEVGVDSQTTVQLSSNGALLFVEVEVEGDSISGDIDDDDSSADVEDCNSADDDSVSSDGDSIDDDSSDGDSDDASSDDCSGSTS